LGVIVGVALALALPEISPGGASSKSSAPMELARAVEQASSAPTGSALCGGERPRGFRMGAGRNRGMGGRGVEPTGIGSVGEIWVAHPKLGALVGALLELLYGI